MFQRQHAHTVAGRQRQLGVTELRRAHAGQRLRLRHHAVDAAIGEDRGIVHAQQHFQGGDQIIAAECIGGLHRHRTLHRRVDHVSHAQHVAEDHLDDFQQVGVLEVQLDIAIGLHARIGDLLRIDEVAVAGQVEAVVVRCGRGLVAQCLGGAGLTQQRVGRQGAALSPLGRAIAQTGIGTTADHGTNGKAGYQGAPANGQSHKHASSF